ncbi:translation initiation factor IF-2 [Desulfobacterales bacterium HSG16]|nr:translation initiation factor IF-2 [Desulfobacterales bacterium HSG16]
MAKIRVYELARDLNMSNKALLNKMKEMNIPVRSHMSSLDDDVVAVIKANVLGKKEGVEVTRVKPTVIRRRKKPKNKNMSENDDHQFDAEDSAPETESDETNTVDPLPVPPAGKGSASKDNLLETEDSSSVEKKLEESPLKTDGKPDTGLKTTVDKESTDKKRGKKKSGNRKKRRRERKDSPARIIKPVEFVEKKAEETETENMKKTEPETVKKIDEVKPLAEGQSKKESDKKMPDSSDIPEEKQDNDSVEQNKSEAPEQLETEKTEKSDLKKADTDKADKDSKSDKPPRSKQEPESKKSVPPKKSRKKSKKIKKDTPAKIIKLPEKVVKKPAVSETKPAPKKHHQERKRHDRKAKPSAAQPQSVPVQPKQMPDAQTDARDDRKKKKEKKTKDNRWAKKKISFKRKEVVEGSALYVGGRGRKGRKGAKGKAAQPQKPQITTPKAIKRRIRMDDTIVLSELAKRMGIKAAEMIKTLMGMGMMVTVNQTIDFDTAVLLAGEFEYEVERISFEEDTLLKKEKSDDPEKMVLRPPVVTIMGHVDHGKTSLLDVIRKTKVTEVEAGGITQHIGAYYVEADNGQIVFLDTPGHEAFTSMRARGAKVTDIVVLVVAADDGVMPQTVEAINHARAAEVPIIVAVNKIDKANAEPDRVQRELSDHGLMSEDWGGDTIFVQVSAKQGTGIDNLLEMILLQAEVLELKANPDKQAIGYVVEAKLDTGRGPVATILVQEGTLNIGEPVVCGVHYGKIRAMMNDRNMPIDTAGPSVPVEIQGLSGVPNAGDELIAVEDDKSAKQVSMHRLQKQRSKDLAKSSRLSLEGLFEQMQEGEVKDLNVIIKADVHGSIEALADSLIKLSNEEVSIKISHSATGTVSESDISLATVSNAIIIGFNVRPSSKVQSMAQEEGVDMRFYNVIYNVIKDVKDAIVGMMDSKYEERILGKAEIREVFHVPKVGSIAGSYVTEGKFKRGQLVRLIRDGVIIYEGKISSLRRFKDDVKEVASGYECGIGIENFNDIKQVDVIECYYMEEIRPELE